VSNKRGLSSVSGVHVRIGLKTVWGNVLLKLPFPIIKRAYVPCFEPAGDAVEMECVLFSQV
jgi:hypothetical protein